MDREREEEEKVRGGKKQQQQQHAQQQHSSVPVNGATNGVPPGRPMQQSPVQNSQAAPSPAVTAVNAPVAPVKKTETAIVASSEVVRVVTGF